jgi:hypothetical protein
MGSQQRVRWARTNACQRQLLLLSFEQRLTTGVALAESSSAEHYLGHWQFMLAKTLRTNRTVPERSERIWMSRMLK